MITDGELRISNESYTHKDFYQIYPEILDLVKKITAKWDPASSNESDPGVVLLKLLAFIADKTNYNIDKNILECFMPSATQEDSMRKLCDMMGYNMKYYQSAVTDVSFMWIGGTLPENNARAASSNSNVAVECIKIPQWTEITDDTGEIIYTLLEDVSLTFKGEVQTKQAIEGKLCDVTINDDNLVKLFNLDDNNRFYLPESKIAENGIWMKNTDDSDWTTWEKKDNLNTVPAAKRVWKFGYDSKRTLPYIQFPDDIADLIGDGLQIKYIRTSGTNGNITAKSLNKLSSLMELPYEGSSEITSIAVSEDEDNYLVIENGSHTFNGQDVETLDEAYNNFKKTIGTFDTLVTCRDYANKIYQLTYNTTNRSPLVSNVQVSDVKDDINFANKIVTFDDFGLLYSDVAVLNNGLFVDSTTTLPGSDWDIDEKIAHVGYATFFNGSYYVYTALGGNTYDWVRASKDSLKNISNFDIYMYPLKDITNYYKGDNYKNSFKPNYLNSYEITKQLEDYKTLSHTLKQISNNPKDIGIHNIYAIKNYYHLTAKISTTFKVTEFEGVEILNNIYYALWHNFNARKNDYGEEIPYDSLLEVIENADSRIKSVSLDEPELTTNVMYGSGEEEQIIDINGDSSGSDVFLTLIAKNVLAGKVPLFNYDNRFKYNLGTQNYASDNRIYGNKLTYPLDPQYIDPDTPLPDDQEFSVTAATTEVEIPVGSINYTLKENEIVNIISPSLRTDKKYSTYINYYFQSGRTPNNSYSPCRLTSLYNTATSEDEWIKRDTILICVKNTVDGVQRSFPRQTFNIDSATKMQQVYSELHSRTDTNRTLFREKNGTIQAIRQVEDSEGSGTYHLEPAWQSGWNYFAPEKLTDQSFITLMNILGDKSVYKLLNTKITNQPGELVDEEQNAFSNVLQYNATARYYLDLSALGSEQTATKQKINTIAGAGTCDASNSDTRGYTAEATSIEPDTEYQLKEGDILYINYTDSNDVIHDIKHWREGNKCYYRDNQNFTIGEIKEFSGIIKPNFKLQNSSQESNKRSYQKTKDSYFIEYDDKPLEGKGMFTLSGTQEIDIRDWVNTNIKTSPFYCYWSVKNNNVLAFKKSKIDDHIYECTLGTDEYFFYTDSLKQSLVTLGSGISLKLHYTNKPTGDVVEWKLGNTDVSLDDIASKGIGAFTDTKWKSIKFTEDYYLEVRENQILSLGEGSTLEQVDLTELLPVKNKDDVSIICYQWQGLNADTFRYNNGMKLTAYDIDNCDGYKIQSVLNINMSNTEGEVINESTTITGTTNKVRRFFKLYTSIWLDANGNPVPYTESKKDTLTEMKKLYKTFESNDLGTGDGKLNFYLKSNYSLMQAGGEYIDLHRYTIEEKLKDDLYIYPYKVSGVTGQASDAQEGAQPDNITLTAYADEYYKISFKDYKEVTLPIFIPKNSFGLLMIYYTPAEGIVSDLDRATVEGALISIFTDTSASNKLVLNKGINVVKIWAYEGESSSQLTLKRNSDDDTGTVVVSDLSIVSCKSNTDLGINYDLLNIAPNKVEDLLAKIRELDPDNLFFYNCPINKYDEIDVNYMDQFSFFNYNNICNKFTIAELDTDESDIQIAKSSRISKW